MDGWMDEWVGLAVQVGGQAGKWIDLIQSAAPNPYPQLNHLGPGQLGSTKMKGGQWE